MSERHREILDRYARVALNSEPLTIRAPEDGFFRLGDTVFEYEGGVCVRMYPLYPLGPWSVNQWALKET